MSDGRHGPVWEELGRIDYFLEHLARAVERGEAPRETYDTLAPRYLTRREEIVRVLTGAAMPVAAESQPHPVAAPFSAPVADLVPGRAPREVRWTQILAYTGAFLVVVAAAIFTVAVWETVSTTAKLAFLGVFTAAFYGAGVLVWRAGMRGGGVALTAVGSAMLLFDGWIAIDGYGMSGPWPWAGLLLVLSAVYWFTETRLTGRFFGITGAAAQIGWWWLLGQGLGWTTAPRFAGIAAVAIAWSIVAEVTREREEFASLAWVLRIAAPVTVAGAAFGVLANLAIGPPRWVDVGSAAVIALAVTAVVDRFGVRWRGIAAAGWLPLLVAIAAMIDVTSPGWGHVGVLVAAAVALGAYELFRGGLGHGIAALVFEAAAWLALADRLDFATDATLAMLVVVGAVWLVAARMMSERIDGDEPLAPYASGFAPVVAVGGRLLLGGVTLFLPEGVLEARREGWGLVLPRETVLAAVFTLGWGAGARLMRAWSAAIVAAAGSFLTVSLLVSGLAPDVHVAFVGCALVALAALWLHAPPISRALSAPLLGRGISWVAGGVLFAFATGLWLVGPPYAEWPVIVLMVAVAALWLSEAWRFSSACLGAAAGPALVGATLLTGDLIDVGPGLLGSALGGVAGAAAGTFICGACVPWGRRSVYRESLWWWALPAGVAASVAALWPIVMLAGSRSADVAQALTVTFALAALAWALGALAVRGTWLSSLSALAAWGSILAALAWLAAPPAVTLAVLTAYAVALMAPTFVRLRSDAPAPLRSALAAPLAAVALTVAAGTVFLGVQSHFGAVLWGGWADLGPWGLTVALVVLGGLLVSAAAPYSIEIAEYAGALAIVAAGWVVLDTAGVRVLEPYLVLLALYIAGSAYRYASGAPAREVPVVSDWAAVACAAWLPALLAVSASTPSDAFTHSVWAVGLSLAAITAGVLLRVRGYLFGGVAALVFVSVWRSFFLLVEFWWAVLGLIGIAMLVIALTWERQQMLLARTGNLVREYFGGWR